MLGVEEAAEHPGGAGAAQQGSSLLVPVSRRAAALSNELVSQRSELETQTAVHEPHADPSCSAVTTCSSSFLLLFTFFHQPEFVFIPFALKMLLSFIFPLNSPISFRSAGRLTILP